MFSSLYRHGAGKGLIPAYRTLSTAQIFGNAGAAEFVAAAGSVTSIPKLRGLPEVSIFTHSFLIH